MKREKFSLRDTTVFLIVVMLFIFFGPSAGWRALGVWQLAFSMKVINERRIGVGWEGFEPSFYITGTLALFIGILNIGISIMLLFYPEQTVMKWGA